MKVPVSWLREYVDAPLDPVELESALVRVGLEVEEIIDLRRSVSGPLLVGQVVAITELTEFKKPIRHCLVDVGEAQPHSIVCGATNFTVGDKVVVILPGGVLPGGFAIASRQAYGRLSDGMICSARELGLGDDAGPASTAAGIIVLPSDVESVPGDDARPVVGLDDVVVDVNVTPDRGYCMSVRGVARELSHSLGVSFRDPGVRAVPAATKEPPYPVRIADPKGCDRFAARLVTGTDAGAITPGWMRHRLSLAGLRPISLSVDITNYVMLELGQPMHAFDAARLHGQLVVRRAERGERLTTLDGVSRGLDPEDLVIVDDSGVISLAAVMGGSTTEVSAATTDILFEAAHWDPVTVGRASRRHRLSSEASKRFERGVDPAIGPVAVERAAELLTRYAGGSVDERVLDINTVAPREPIVIATDGPSRIAGVTYPARRVTALLREVGAEVAPAGTKARAAGSATKAGSAGSATSSGSAGGDRIAVTPPSWRPDLTDAVDLAEEVIRLDGYDKVPSVLPQAPAGRGLTPRQRRRRSVGRTLAEAGYVEVLSYPFVSTGTADALGLPSDDIRRSAVRLANPLSAQEPLMRTSLLAPVLATLRRNVGRGSRDVALYEQGMVFHAVHGARTAAAGTAAAGTAAAGTAAARTPAAMGVDRRPSEEDFAAADALLPHQPWHVAAVLAGEIEPTGWWGPGRQGGWADAVEAARAVCAVAGVAATVRAATYAPWHPGRCAEIVVAGGVVAGSLVTGGLVTGGLVTGGLVAGHAGELHPAVCAAFDLPRRTCAMELNLDVLPLPGVTPAPVVSTFPPALIDVALVVEASVPAGEVEAALVEGAGELLEAVRLFDVFTGAQVGVGRKSLAYKLTFRASDRTLTAEEAVAARDAAVASASSRVGATLRGG